MDYYDAAGNNAKKFLMRKPVRADDPRLTSGFGLRFHPLLNEKRMHTGVDWASTPGTPVLAAGNGTIEEAGRKGQYGNYIRIRHANGYQTAYGHMARFAQGAAPGVQGSPRTGHRLRRLDRIVIGPASSLSRCWSTISSSIPCRSRCPASTSSSSASSVNSNT